MKQHGGVWLPDDETHLVAWMNKVNHRVDGKLTYQHKKIEAALAYVRNWRVAVDIGAHCGLWSMHLAKRFGWVLAFEPVKEHGACFKMNVDAPNVSFFPVALGEKDSVVSLHQTSGSSGDTWINPGSEGRYSQPYVPIGPLDDLFVGQGLMEMYEAGFADVDFVKVDVEGFELYALRGAEKLLRRCKPVVIVEQKPGRAEKYGLPRTGAVTYLESLGYRLRETLSGDYILTA